jgi:hypothetical protein
VFAAFIRKELLAHLGGFPFAFLTLVTLVMAFLSTQVSVERYQLRVESYRQQVQAEAERLARLPTYSFLQPRALRPPEPLAVFDPGVMEGLGGEVKIHLFAVPTAADAQGGQGTDGMGAFQGLGLTAVVRGLLGLLALLLTFDAFVGERQRGTLRLILANPVPRGLILAGKWAGGMTTLALPLLGAWLLTTGMMVFAGGMAPAMAWNPRSLALGVLYLLYLGVMLLLGLTISLHARSAATALGLCLLLWLVAVFLLPHGGAPPSSGTTAGAEGETARQMAGLRQERDERLATLWREHPLRVEPGAFSSAYLRRFADGAVLRRFGSRPYYEALQEYHGAAVPLVAEYAARIDALRGAGATAASAGPSFIAPPAMPWAALSPAALLDPLSRALAGTSVADQQRFLAACREYRQALLDHLRDQGAFTSWRWFTDDPPDALYPWPRFLDRDPAAVPPTEVDALFNRLREPAVQAALLQRLETMEADPRRRIPIDDLPPLRIPPPGLGNILVTHAPEGAALGAWATLLALLAWRRCRHYEVGE